MSDASTADLDVVDLLKQQHEQIRDLFAAVETASEEDRQARFRELRAFLAVHETAEEMVVHPAARKEGAVGAGIADRRLAEEREAKEVLAELDGMDPMQTGFLTRLGVFKQMVISHAEAEEREEMPLLREQHDEARLRKMAAAVRAAERIAPTRPHPGVESATKNLLLGPVASIVDRTRDAVRSVMDR